MQGASKGSSEIKYSHLLQVLCLMFFFVVWLLDSFFFNVTTFLASLIPLITRIVASLIIIVTGSILIAKAHQQLFKNKLNDLVTTGIFAYVRHPMYLGIILTYLGYIVGTLSLLTLAPWFLILILYVRMANYEEEQLEKRFGKEYLNYKKRVPKWIPEIKGWKLRI